MCQLPPPWFCKGQLSDPWFFYGSSPWVFPFSLILHASSSLTPELLAFFLSPHWFFQWLTAPWSRIPIPLLKLEPPTSWIGSESPVHDNSLLMMLLHVYHGMLISYYYFLEGQGVTGCEFCRKGTFWHKQVMYDFYKYNLMDFTWSFDSTITGKWNVIGIL
jgi:hypothetical protein